MIGSSSRIVITGGGQGIGRALARHFVEKGHKIFILDVNKEGLQHTAETHLKDYSDRVAWSDCDLSDSQSVRDTIEKAAKYLGGGIDFLINNAGISYPYWPDGKTMEDKSTLDMWKKYVDVNLTGNFVLSQACIPYMKVKGDDEKQKLPDSKTGSAGPCILNVSSFRGVISDPNQEGYAATKAGLIGLTTAMAVSLQHYGIRVNCVSPGRIKVTHENKQADKEGTEWDVAEDDVETHPTNRPGMPEDITEAAEYLLGAGFVTGQNLLVDGGAGELEDDSDIRGLALGTYQSKL
ncbi:hypothetical protein PMZ80_000340 [Knufia obscura]|uniref:Uncharacterized protein n=1 Tax=Knufia obscura TaxID=1635080 RepID=A0ABR0S027_9EURO|nr:hypothetical protein PMZ80_000340 [Knufia obscura]